MLRKRGFTLIELMVVVAISALILGVILPNFPQIRNQLVVTTEARNLALNLRKAQSYAIAVRQFNPANYDDPFCDPALPNSYVKFPPYGVSISKKVSAASQEDPRYNKTYVIFGDANCDKGFSPKTGTFPYESDEIVEQVNLNNGAYIDSINAYNGSCNPCAIDNLEIKYQRPSPSVTIIESGVSGTLYSSAEITIKASGGNVFKKVIVRLTGQISLQ